MNSTFKLSYNKVGNLKIKHTYEVYCTCYNQVPMQKIKNDKILAVFLCFPTVSISIIYELNK